MLRKDAHTRPVTGGHRRSTGNTLARFGATLLLAVSLPLAVDNPLSAQAPRTVRPAPSTGRTNSPSVRTVAPAGRSTQPAGTRVETASTANRTLPTGTAPTGTAPTGTAPTGTGTGAVAGPQLPQPVGISTQQLKIMAVVNGEQVSRQQLAQECLERYGEEVLETMINRYVIVQACQTRGVRITEQDVDQEIKELASKFGLSVERWLEMLEKERDLPPDQYRREIVWPTLALRRLAADKLVVTDDDLKKAWETEYGPKIKARLIVVSSREKAEQLHARAVANPELFGQLAKDESEDATSASVRGMIPPIRMHAGAPEVQQVAFRLEEGQISPVIQVANQYLILQCEQRLPEMYIAENFRANAEAQLRERIRDQKLRDAATDLFKKLQDEAQVVNVYNSPERRQQMPGVAAMINGQQIPIHQLAEECITRHGKEVLDGEINRMLLAQELKRRGLSIERPDLEAEVARAADAYGYVREDGTPDVQAWLAEVEKEQGATVQLYIDDAVWPSVALKKLVAEHPDVRVTQEDLQKGFESNYGERVEALAIVLSSQRQASRVWEMARNRPTDQAFGELAQQYSVEPVSRANFGKVPPIRRHSGQPNLEKEAFALQAGQLSGIIAVADKYIILRCLGRTQPVVEEFEAVKGELYKDLYEKKLRLAMASEFDRLKEGAQIDNFLAGTSQSGKRGITAGPAAGPNLPAAATGQAPAAGARR